MASAETDFHNAFSSARVQQLQSRLAHGRFAALKQQIIDAADFIVERSCLVFRLKYPKNGGMSGGTSRVHAGQIQSRLRMDFNSRRRFEVVLG